MSIADSVLVVTGEERWIDEAVYLDTNGVWHADRGAHPHSDAMNPVRPDEEMRLNRVGDWRSGNRRKDDPRFLLLGVVALSFAGRRRGEAHWLALKCGSARNGPRP